MAAIDAETIASGISGIVLVERAGKGVWAIAAERYHAGSQTAAVFLCGKGNNGADGFVAARAAKADGLDPVVFLFAREGDVSGEALHHLQAAREAGVRIHTDSDLGKSILHQPLSFCRSRLRRIAWNGLEGSTKASSGGRNRRPQRVFGETSCR